VTLEAFGVSGEQSRGSGSRANDKKVTWIYQADKVNINFILTSSGCSTVVYSNRHGILRVIARLSYLLLGADNRPCLTNYNGQTYSIFKELSRSIMLQPHLARLRYLNSAATSNSIATSLYLLHDEPGSYMKLS